MVIDSWCVVMCVAVITVKLCGVHLEQVLGVLEDTSVLPASVVSDNAGLCLLLMRSLVLLHV